MLQQSLQQKFPKEKTLKICRKTKIKLVQNRVNDYTLRRISTKV